METHIMGVAHTLAAATPMCDNDGVYMCTAHLQPNGSARPFMALQNILLLFLSCVATLRCNAGASPTYGYCDTSIDCVGDGVCFLNTCYVKGLYG